MSAYVVDELHIQYLVNFAEFTAPRHGASFHFGEEIYNLRTAAHLTALATALLNTNIDSVNYRYEESEPHRELPWKPLAIIDWVENIGQVFSAVSGYEYQACERPDYPESLAAAFMTFLTKRAGYYTPGYGAASWEITKESPCITRSANVRRLFS